MKKLTKRNLDELAVNMPIIDEKEQQDIIGGTFYYSASGQLIHATYDGSNEMRVVLDINNWVVSGGGMFDPISGSYSLNEVGSNVVANVLSHIASSIGISGAIGVTYRSGTAAWVDSSGQIFFNNASNIFDEANYYDILSVLNHEHHHQMTMYDHGTTGSEIAALEYEMSLSTFHLTSPEYQSDTLALYNRLKNL
ncbi:MAG: hypothetical protein WCZ43_01955 [Proteiniphilum sp.]